MKTNRIAPGFIAILVAMTLLGCQTAPAPRRIPGAWPPQPVQPPAASSQNVVAPVAFQTPLDGDEGGSIKPLAPPSEPQARETVTPEVTTKPEENNAATQVVENSNLDLLDFEGLALQNSPSLAEAMARADAAEGAWLQAGLPPNPRLGYSGQQIGSRGVAEQQGIFIGQQLIRGGKLRLSQQVAKWRVEMARQEVEATRLRLLTDVRIAFFQLLAAQQRQRFADDLVRSSEQALAAAKALHVGEEVSEADPLRAKIAADSARLIQQNGAYRLQEAKRRLLAVVGTPELVMGQVRGELETSDEPLDWDQTLHSLLNSSPTMAVASANIERAEWAVERAHAEAISDIDIQAVIQDDRATGAANGSLQVTMPIPIRNRNQGGIHKAHAEATAAQLAADRVALRLRSQLAEAFRRYQSARGRVAKFRGEDGMIANATKSIQLIRAGYDIEQFGVLDLLNAQRSLYEARLSYLDSLAELRVVEAEIQGKLLKGSLSD